MGATLVIPHYHIANDRNNGAGEAVLNTGRFA
jgi:hypothetical protein